MKTLKKLLASLFAVVLGASLMTAPTAAFADISYDSSVASAIYNGSFIIDKSGLLSQSDEYWLQSMAQDVLSKNKVAAYYVTVDSLEGYSDAVDYADAFVEEYGLQNAASNGCAVMVVCVNAGKFSIVSYGACAKQLDDATIEYLITDIQPYLGRSDWAGAGETYFGDVTQTMVGQKANAVSDIKYNGTYVTDDYGLFTNDQRAALEAKATQLAQDYNMGVYLLVVDNMGARDTSSAQRTNFATSFYRANDLGLGSGKDGVLFVLAPGSREYVTIAYGQGSYSFSDEGINAMEENVVSYLSNDNWYKGAEAYYSSIGEQLEYYSVSGKPWTEPDPLSLLLKILAILGIPAAVAFGKVGSEKSAMKTAHEKHEASGYMRRGSFKLTRSHDQFVNTTMAVTPIPKSEPKSHGGGGSSFGGGGWGGGGSFGGGGGGFSSSGGGKF